MGLFGVKNLFIAGLFIALFSVASTYVLINERTKTKQFDKIAVLEANEKLYQSSINSLNQTVSWYEDFVNRQRIEFERTQNEFDLITQQNREFRERLESLELSKAAAENPSAVEIILNDITRQTNRCFELATGAPLTQAEKDAKNAEEFNAQCTWLFTDRRVP